MKIGILGGTFDPPHFGHLNLAEEAKLKLGLDRVIFMPAQQSPLKPGEILSNPLLRYRMIRLAVRNHPGFEVSDIELRRTPPSYTIDTLREIRSLYPYPHEIFFIAGSDTLRHLGQWKDFPLICEMCCFVVASRPDFQLETLPDGVRPLSIREIDISSSEIRRRVNAGEDVSTFVPYRVLQVIDKESMYRKVA